MEANSHFFRMDEYVMLKTHVCPEDKGQCELNLGMAYLLPQPHPRHWGSGPRPQFIPGAPFKGRQGREPQRLASELLMDQYLKLQRNVEGGFKICL